MSDVKAFWEGRAKDESHNDSDVTHRDVWQRWLEIETIKRYLRPGDRLLDVGCGAGYSTRLFASHVREAVGVDYSESMIERARRASTGDERLRFEVADCLTLGPGQVGEFDVALSVRCLINLPGGWPEQQQAIRNIAGVLKPGGRFILLEGLEDGRNNLDRLRVESGLDAMPKVWHNIDFSEAALLPFLEPMFTIEDRRHFGVYDFVARVVHPKLVAPEPPAYEARINQVAAELALHRQDFPDLSRVICLILVRQ
jgi:SAM-dependent methyltransferase